MFLLYREPHSTSQLTLRLSLALLGQELNQPYRDHDIYLTYLITLVQQLCVMWLQSNRCVHG